MVEAVLTDLKVTVKFEKGSFTYGDLKLNAPNDKIFDLATAMNTLQSKTPVEIVKTEVSALSSY